MDWNDRVSQIPAILASTPMENHWYLHRARLELIDTLVAHANQDAGVACLGCSGVGHKMYGSTATWRGGIGGAAMTVDVCDKCWGTGRTDTTGPDLRKYEREMGSLFLILRKHRICRTCGEKSQAPLKAGGYCDPCLNKIREGK